MNSKFFKAAFVVFGAFFVIYLILPTPNFPPPPEPSIRSFEPADSETPERRGYYTDLTREEVQEHYRSEYIMPYGLSFITQKLTYPPEEAFSLVRDQTRSTHLVELVHPLRSSLFINEYIAKEAKDKMYVNDKEYLQKITVKQIDSSAVERVAIGVMILVVLWLLTKQWVKLLSDIASILPNIKYIFKD